MSQPDLPKISPPIEFDTKRLRLRQWRESDCEPLAELNNDPKVMEFFPALINRAATIAAVARWKSQIAERGWGLWAAEIRDSNEVIGFVGLQVPMTPLPFSPCVEIGWRLAFRYWGKGYATEAARGALKVGFEQLQLHEIVSFTAASNRRSRSVMERLGMRPAKTTFEHPAIPLRNPLREHCLYTLTRAAWTALTQTPPLRHTPR